MTSIITHSHQLATLNEEELAKVEQELNDLVASCNDKSTLYLLGGRLVVTRDELTGNYIEL